MCTTQSVLPAYAAASASACIQLSLAAPSPLTHAMLSASAWTLLCRQAAVRPHVPYILNCIPANAAQAIEHCLLARRQVQRSLCSLLALAGALCAPVVVTQH